MPVASMAVTALMSTEQLMDRKAPLYPAKRVTYEWERETTLVYRVPIFDQVRELALVKSGSTESQFIDPQHPEAGLITWEGRWQTLDAAYEFAPVWSNLTILFNAVRFDNMLRNSLFIAIVGEIGVLVSSILVAYGFARYPLPGGNLLFYILIATIVIPEKVTFVPTYFFNMAILDWKGTMFPCASS
jgi:multiple sugar transport system permease protein